MLAGVGVIGEIPGECSQSLIWMYCLCIDTVIYLPQYGLCGCIMVWCGMVPQALCGSSASRQYVTRCSSSLASSLHSKYLPTILSSFLLIFLNLTSSNQTVQVRLFYHHLDHIISFIYRSVHWPRELLADIDVTSARAFYHNNTTTDSRKKTHEMRFRWATGLLVVLATSEAVGASNWFSRSGMCCGLLTCGMGRLIVYYCSVQQLAWDWAWAMARRSW